MLKSRDTAREAELIRAVIDTNVLVSAMISSSGNEALVVMALNQELRTACFSPEILKDVLRRPKFGFPADEVTPLLAVLRRHGSLLDPVPINHISILTTTRSARAPSKQKLISL
jgi:predicted nucleic acid-binding protein